MSDFPKIKEYGIWVKLHCFAIFMFLPYFILHHLAEGYYGVFFNYYIYSIPVLVAFYYFFRRGMDGLEVKLLLAFCVWLFISRVLNGDFSLAREISVLRSMFVMLLSTTACMVLSPQKRLCFVDCVSAVMCLFCTVLSVFGIYGALYQTPILNPLTGGPLVEFYGAQRLYFFDLDPNIVAIWFFISVFLLVYLFFRTRKWFLKLLLAIAAILNYITIALTYCRNVMLCTSVAVAMLAILIAFNYISPEKKKLKALVVLVVMCTVMPLTYSSFSLTTSVVGKFSHAVISEEETDKHIYAAEYDSAISVSQNTPADNNSNQIDFSDERGFSLNGRGPLYLSFIETIKTYPVRLIKGCMLEDVMEVTNSTLPYFQGHFHNVFLQTIVYTGIPGLAIVAAFLFLLIKRMVLLYFSTDCEIHMSTKVLVILLSGAITYNIVDCFLFYNYGITSLLFFIISGAVIAASKEHRLL